MATLDLQFQAENPAALRPLPGAHAVHVWKVDLTGAMEPDLLGAAERERASRMGHEGARMDFVRSRTALRQILGAYTGMEPAKLPISLAEGGKPFLDLPDAPQFNLSHSGASALIAVTAAAPVGVDIETIRPVQRLERIADAYFSAAEKSALLALPETERLDAFYACWTRKEAAVKATGRGIAHAFSRFDVTLTPGEPAQLVSIRGELKAQDFTLHAFRVVPQAWAAVCVAAPGFAIEAFTFARTTG